jgi:hypothetical protein
MPSTISDYLAGIGVEMIGMRMAKSFAAEIDEAKYKPPD